MADFAKSQLQKYGWKEGQGLGKSQSGISKPIKVSLKSNLKGFGFKSGAEFNFNWWEHVYDKAANSIEICKSGEEVCVKKKIDGEIKINSHSINYNSSSGNKKLYDVFIKSGVLVDNTLKCEQETKRTTTSKAEEFYRIPDEELFKKCQGRTAHRAARHGMKLNGKLQRIEDQEKNNSHIKKITESSAHFIVSSDLSDAVEKISSFEVDNNEHYSPNQKRKMKSKDKNKYMNAVDDSSAVNSFKSSEKLIFSERENIRNEPRKKKKKMHDEL